MIIAILLQLLIVFIVLRYFVIMLAAVLSHLCVYLQGQTEVPPSSQARQKLEGLLNKNMRIRMTDGRTLVGLFLCTDRDCNVILGSAQEFLKSPGNKTRGNQRRRYSWPVLLHTEPRVTFYFNWLFIIVVG